MYYSVSFILLIISIILSAGSCISPYEPDTDEQSGILVVDAGLIKGLKTQAVLLSKTTPLSDKKFSPVEHCQVKIMDTLGKEFAYAEKSPGTYVVDIDDAWLKYDMKYRLTFITPSGDIYESDYQQLLKTPPVDSIYGLKEFRYSSETNSNSKQGLQFYVDLNAPEDASKYYRWTLEEIYEQHSASYIWGVFDGQNINRFYPPDSLFCCYITEQISGLYSASTDHLSENRITKVPLHFIESSSDKLAFKYCATIKQYALNKDAYEYWYHKEKELNKSGGIYTSQPDQSISNIHNTSNSQERILGFFWVSSLTQKRIFVVNPFQSFSPDLYCEKGVYQIYSDDPNVILATLYYGLNELSDQLPDPPVYITLSHGIDFHIYLTSHCIDCRLNGGVLRKPDFWE